VGALAARILELGHQRVLQIEANDGETRLAQGESNTTAHRAKSDDALFCRHCAAPCLTAANSKLSMHACRAAMRLPYGRR